jgi:hypothetical protein
MKYVYMLGGLFFILIPIIQIRDDIEDYRTQIYGTEVGMTIESIPGSCMGTKNKYSMRVKYLNKTYEKAIGGNFCETHRVGDNITMKYLQNSDNIMFLNETKTSEFISCFLLVVFGILILLFGLGFMPKLLNFFEGNGYRLPD